MSTPVVPASPPEPPRKPSEADKIVQAFIKEIDPGRLLIAALAALVAVLATILGLAAIVSPYVATAGAFGAFLPGIAAIVRAWRDRS